MKTIFCLCLLTLSLQVLALCFENHPPTDQFLGDCSFQGSIVSVYQNQATKTENILGFEFYHSTCEKIEIQSRHQILFFKEYIWPWTELNQIYLKYRNGRRATGMFAWNRISGLGYLRYYQKFWDETSQGMKEEEFFLDLKNCNINMKDMDLIEHH